MTNGEKIQKDFKGCEVCEPIVEDDIIHVIFADKKDSAIGFDLSWWNAEYKEPTTKNDLGVDCISRDSAIKALDYDIKCFEFKRGVNRHMDDIAKLLNTIYETQVNNIKALPSTPQEPKIIPIAEIKYDEDKLKELVNKAVLTVTSQEPIIDKIRAEIKDIAFDWQEIDGEHESFMVVDLNEALQIIDKYKAETEDKE